MKFALEALSVSRAICLDRIDTDINIGTHPFPTRLLEEVVGVVESDDVRKIVVVQKLLVDSQQVRIGAKNVVKFAQNVAVFLGNLLQPFAYQTFAFQRESRVFREIPNHKNLYLCGLQMTKLHKIKNYSNK